MIGTDEPVAVRPGEEINLEALNDYLKKKYSSIGTIKSKKQFPGGYSNLTYLLHSEKGEFILRRPPFGAAIKSAHDMGREFNVISLLREHYSKIPSAIICRRSVDGRRRVTRILGGSG
jgi:aminoglycoside phosphotransferase (APT) family kinase protein